MILPLFCPLAPNTLGISSFSVLCAIQPEKCQEQDGDLPEQLSVETLKAEAMPAGEKADVSSPAQLPARIRRPLFSAQL